jgi:hypothetical protein
MDGVFGTNGRQEKCVGSFGIGTRSEDNTLKLYHIWEEENKVDVK